MDRQNLIKKLKSSKLLANKKARMGAAALIVVLAGAFGTGYWKSHHAAKAATDETEEAESGKPVQESNKAEGGEQAKPSRKKSGEVAKTEKTDKSDGKVEKKSGEKSNGAVAENSEGKDGEKAEGAAEKTEPKTAESTDEKAVETAAIPSNIFQTFTSAIHSTREKISTIADSVAENDRLKLENARLRLALESVKFDCGAKEAANHTAEISGKLDKETGARMARTWDTIAYRPPTNIIPTQLYTLGVSYFKGREDEKAAVIFTILTGMEDNDAFRTAKNYLMTGVAWYRLDNLKAADEYFQKVIQAPPSEREGDGAAYIAQARLWRSIVAERLGKHQQSQDYLRELVDYHPHSTEAAWVNSREASRATASEE